MNSCIDCLWESLGKLYCGWSLGVTSRIVWIRSWALQGCCVNLGNHSFPVPQFPQVRHRNHYFREGRTMLGSRCSGVRFVWLFTDCLQGESGTFQTSEHCWSLPHLHTGRDSLRRSPRGANGVSMRGLQDASVSPQTNGFVLKSFSSSPTSFAAHAHINLAFQETPKFLLPKE